jgi:acetyl-CoA C-acetyltransferase
MKNDKKRVWLVSGSRTPIGSFGKSLRGLTVDKLGAHSMKHALRRAGITANALDDVIFGHGYQTSYTLNTARVAAMEAGIPDSVPALTVQRQCGSGMESTNLGMDKIQLGRAGIVLVGGAESMSTVPYLIDGSNRWKGFMAKRFPKIVRLGPFPALFKMADNGLAPTRLIWDMKSVYMAGTAQRIADTYGITREAADEYSLRSQELANKAVKSGRFDIEIDPIETGRGRRALKSWRLCRRCSRLVRSPRATALVSMTVPALSCWHLTRRCRSTVSLRSPSWSTMQSPASTTSRWVWALW